MIGPDSLLSDVQSFNAWDDDSEDPGWIRNAEAGDWLAAHAPRLDCPDPELLRTWHFRWWTYRKHLRRTPHGLIVTEFLPDVDWAGPCNSISCAAGFHLQEGRWLRDPDLLLDYCRFWLRGPGEPRRYSFWIASAMRRLAQVRGDARFAIDLLPELQANYRAWERGCEPSPTGPIHDGDARLGPSGLYWQIDDRDGMELSIGGSGYRATISSYQYGDALAIADLAERAGDAAGAATYRDRAASLRAALHEQLWDADARFFKVKPRTPDDAPLADVRELHGYTPWAFGMAEPHCAAAWSQLVDPAGFAAPFGPCTAERQHPRFLYEHEHDCLWNGYSWPFATAMTLDALAGFMRSQPEQQVLPPTAYLDLLGTYSRSHRRTLADGRVIPWIDEDLDPFTGEWECRRKLIAKGLGTERGRHYNHSAFCDQVIHGLIGVCPSLDGELTLSPLVPADSWDWFCLDRVPYHGRDLTVVWDRDGSRYGGPAGLRLLIDGAEAHRQADLSPAVLAL